MRRLSSLLVDVVEERRWGRAVSTPTSTDPEIRERLFNEL
jgi:hypothetical protein